MNKLVKYSNIEYFMPFLFCNDIFIPLMHKFLENEKNPIKYVYGSPYCEWGIGARYARFKFNNLSVMEKYLQNIRNKYGMIPTFTFTNLDVKDNLNDEYSNNILDIAYSLDCRFIVAKEELYNHIKSRYPDAKMHCSIINPIMKYTEDKDFKETEFYNEMLDKYEVVVVRPEYIINNIDNLDKLLSDLSRIEVLINHYCHFNCTFFRQHHDYVIQVDKYGLANKDRKYYTEDNLEEFSLCPKESKEFRSSVLTEEQTKKIIDLGVKKLKIQGRSYTFDMLFDELYRYFFNNEFSEEELRNKADKICAEMLENNKKAALMLLY